MRKKGMLVLGIMAAATAIGIYFGRRRKQAYQGGAVSRPPLSCREKGEYQCSFLRIGQFWG